MNLLRPAMYAAAGVCAGITALTLVNLRHLRRPDSTDTQASISVLMPARDEAQRIGPALAALRDLRGVEQILVLDDNSTDDTAALVRQAGLEVLPSAQEPPAGWHGKPWACQRLAQAATGEVLVFIDADVVLAPDAALRAAAMLDEVDLVCPYPRQVVTGPLQRLVQPLLQWSWLSFLPLRLAERSADPLLSAGNGQFLAVRAEAYRAVGGHEAVRDEVLEDIALVRALKSAGFTTAMADGTHIATCHMYADDRAMIDGYTKSLHDGFPPAVIALLNALYVVPAVVAITTSDARTRAAALSAYGMAVLGRVLVARRTCQPVADCLAHPASILTLTGIYARSVRAQRRGEITWRGRRL